MNLGRNGPRRRGGARREPAPPPSVPAAATGLARPGARRDRGHARLTRPDGAGARRRRGGHARARRRLRRPDRRLPSGAVRRRRGHRRRHRPCRLARARRRRARSDGRRACADPAPCPATLDRLARSGDRSRGVRSRAPTSATRSARADADAARCFAPHASRQVARRPLRPRAAAARARRRDARRRRRLLHLHATARASSRIAASATPAGWRRRSGSRADARAAGRCV